LLAAASPRSMFRYADLGSRSRGSIWHVTIGISTGNAAN
jgi:hypothetical protein